MEDEEFYSYYFGLTKIIVSMMGQWPFQTKTRKYLLRTLVLGAMLSIVPPMVGVLVIEWGKDWSEVIKAFPALLTVLACCCKSAASFYNEPKIADLLSQLKHNFQAYEKMELEVLEEYGRKTRTVLGFYSVYIYTSLVAFLSIPLLPVALEKISPPGVNETPTRMLLFPVYYGPDTDVYWFEFLFHSYITSTMTISILVACDTMYITLIFYNCSIFAVVRKYIENVGDGSEVIKNADTKNSTKVVFARIKKCIIAHHRAIRCANVIESIYVWNFLSIIGINMIIISLTGLQAMMTFGEWQEFITSAIFTAAQLLHLLLLSFPGQLLINESESVRDSTYDCDWYNVPPNAQKMLLLLLLRSLEPCEITAGKMFVMKMETFTSILQTSASYFTVLASFQ